MISPEILRRFPFFYGFDDSQLKALAMIANEHEIDQNTVLFEESKPAQNLYLLLDGAIDLLFTPESELKVPSRRELPVGEISPGEVFGIGSLIEPYTFTLTARSAQPGKVIEFDAISLRAIMQVDVGFSCNLNTQVTKILMARLHSTRILLAAAYA